MCWDHSRSRYTSAMNLRPAPCTFSRHGKKDDLFSCFHADLFLFPSPLHWIWFSGGGGGVDGGGGLLVGRAQGASFEQARSVGSPLEAHPLGEACPVGQAHNEGKGGFHVLQTFLEESRVAKHPPLVEDCLDTSAEGANHQDFAVQILYPMVG